MNAERPCPFASCRHHLAIEVDPSSGALKRNFPRLELWQLAETCSLDVAEREGMTLEGAGDLLNLTRERVRQIEVRALAKVKRRSEAVMVDEPRHPMGARRDRTAEEAPERAVAATAPTNGHGEGCYCFECVMVRSGALHDG